MAVAVKRGGENRLLPISPSSFIVEIKVSYVIVYQILQAIIENISVAYFEDPY